jgi:hypothetical protein
MAINIDMKLSKVTWLDINSGDRWMDLEEAIAWGEEKYAADFVTVGYILHQTPDFVIIAATIDTDQESYHDISMIPCSVIKSITPLA